MYINTVYSFYYTVSHRETNAMNKGNEMQTVNTKEARRNISRLIDKVNAGEEIRFIREKPWRA